MTVNRVACDVLADRSRSANSRIDLVRVVASCRLFVRCLPDLKAYINSRYPLETGSDRWQSPEAFRQKAS
jgi:hypothetical protein